MSSVPAQVASKIFGAMSPQALIVGQLAHNGVKLAAVVLESQHRKLETQANLTIQMERLQRETHLQTLAITSETNEKQIAIASYRRISELAMERGDVNLAREMAEKIESAQKDKSRKYV